MGTISLTIDGQGVEVQEGKTILQASREAGIVIPTICDHKDLNPYGACRMCVVEIEGVRGFPTSCTTPASDGMVVKTQSAELTTLRNRTLELMLSGHPNSCLVCVHREACEKYRPGATKAGRATRCGFCSNREECSLREMALRAGENELGLPTLYSAHNVERSDPFMDRDYNLCILCGRCWRICEKIHGKPAISIINRGKWARLGTAFHKSHVFSGCTFCGSCIDICPTGTLTDRFARWYGKPDDRNLSACTLCAEGCSLFALTKSRRLVATRMTSFQWEASLCALGRFALAQIVNAPERLIRPAVQEGEDQIPCDWDTALELAASELPRFTESLAIVVSESTTREDRFLYARLAERLGASLIVVPSSRNGVEKELQGFTADLEKGRFRAVISGGDFLSAELLKGLNFSVVIDCLPSSGARGAKVVLPAAVLSEVEGTWRNVSGEVKELPAVSLPPGQARPEWQIICQLAQKMGLEGFEFKSAREVTSLVGSDPAPRPFDGEPRRGLRQLPSRFRGHLAADWVRPLEAFGMPSTPLEEMTESSKEGFEILERREVVPNMYFIKIMAPQVAKFAKPGQFVILMARETSERSPFTLVDWNGAEGTISLIIEEVGRSSRELISLPVGARVAHVSGPLGMPLPMEKKGTVVLGGGCYGIGAIYPIARGLREAGNHVIVVIEASSSYLLFMEDELKTVSDELIIATKDGSRGTRGGVQEVFVNLVQRGVDVAMFVAVGCTFMMRMAAEATKPLGIPTLVALNPIMVDGTGMCGACRVSIEGRTRFACVDGPFFDAHGVDWDELFSRRSAYSREEIEAMPQMVDLNALIHPHGSGGGCGSSCSHR